MLEAGVKKQHEDYLRVMNNFSVYFVTITTLILHMLTPNKSKHWSRQGVLGLYAKRTGNENNDGQVKLHQDLCTAKNLGNKVDCQQWNGKEHFQTLCLTKYQCLSYIRN